MVNKMLPKTPSRPIKNPITDVSIPECNLDKSRPPLELARKLMISFIETERKRGRQIVKIIHGWGSSGVGGSNRIGLRETLQKMQRENRIKEFIPGEDLPSYYWIIDDPIQRKYPILKFNPECCHKNQGITLVVIQ
jgi:hypothetical protein